LRKWRADHSISLSVLFLPESFTFEIFKRYLLSFGNP
jgi:hypothetical protein